MPKKTCQHCGCSEIDTDTARGDSVCTNCGSVLEANIIVSEVQFEEGSHGGSRAVGQMVSSEGQSTGGLNLGFQHGLGKESRQLTLQKARRRIVQMAEQLRLNQHCIDMAYNFYKMALTKHLTRGRKSTHVIAACVYMVCRIEGTPHFLLDLSDIVQVNVYELGRTYLHLSAALCLNIPFIDPCIYIVRFAHRLEFGDKTHEVSMTAHRLVQRMKRDWIHTGRRPSGLCGAALIMAARMHDFNRTIKDIIKVVKVCETTLRKRLLEFGDTPSGELTMDEFMAIDLEEEQDPPCFKEARRKHKELQAEETPETTQEIQDLQNHIEKALEERKKKKISGPYSKLAAASTSSETETLEPVEEEQVTEQFIIDETVESINEFLHPDQPSKNVSDEDAMESILLPQDGNSSGRNSPIIRVIENDEDVDNPEIVGQAETHRRKGLAPTAASLGLKESIEECMRVNTNSEIQEGDGELDLTGIDDEELDKYIMSENEIEAKTQLWTKVHAEYLAELKVKEEKKAREAEENANKPETKKRKRQTRKKGNIQANTAGEAIEKMLQEKKISSKINYDVLKSLKTSDIRGETSSTTEEVFKTPKVPSRPSSRTAKSPVGGAPPAAITNIMSSILSFHNNKRKNSFSDEKSPKLIKKDEPKEQIEEKPATPVPITAEEDEEEEIEEEEEVKEDAPLSVAELLGHHRGDEDGDMNYFEDEEYFDDG